ncbi:MAG: GNAT family N-acetyltransferase [Thermoplasmata archaeon]|nr:GNAT family N-acetyltransferase [Thermoplasmata archaeon]
MIARDIKVDNLEISHLDKRPLEDLVDAQNKIFADYIIPLKSSVQFFQDFTRSVGGNIEDVIVAVHNGAIVGYVNPIVDDKEAWIGGLGVIPEYRGSGIGKRLMRAAEEDVRERGAEEILLEVIDGNTPALNLYHNLGYTERRTYLSAEGQSARFAGFGPAPERGRLEDVEESHRLIYTDNCWQRRKSAALAESGRTCETYAVDGGFVMLRRAGTTGFIPFIGVLPDMRRRGVGTSLAKFAINRLWELGAFKIAIYNVNDDMATRRMLDKFDFAVTLKQFEMKKSIR